MGSQIATFFIDIFFVFQFPYTFLAPFAHLPTFYIFSKASHPGPNPDGVDELKVKDRSGKVEKKKGR